MLNYIFNACLLLDYKLHEGKDFVTFVHLGFSKALFITDMLQTWPNIELMN